MQVYYIRENGKLLWICRYTLGEGAYAKKRIIKLFKKKNG